MTSSMLAFCAWALASTQVLCQASGEENKIPLMETQLEPHHDTRPKSTAESSFRRALSNLPGRRIGRLRSGQDIDSLRQALLSQVNNWGQFTPTTSHTTDPECFVEIKVTQRVPGRCTRLGPNRLPACQAQDLLSMDYENCGTDD